MKSKIKLTSQANKSKLIKTNVDLIEVQHYKHPIFCFKYIHKDYSLHQCTGDEKIAFVEQLFKLSQLSWQEIEYTDRHGLGTEKIPVSSIKSSMPTLITEEVKFLLALRFLGKLPFIGYRDRFLFHVIFIDRNHILY